jgi:hypothetical protein
MIKALSENEVDWKQHLKIPSAMKTTPCGRPFIFIFLLPSTHTLHLVSAVSKTQTSSNYRTYRSSHVERKSLLHGLILGLYDKMQDLERCGAREPVVPLFIVAEHLLQNTCKKGAQNNWAHTGQLRNHSSILGFRCCSLVLHRRCLGPVSEGSSGSHGALDLPSFVRRF